MKMIFILSMGLLFSACGSRDLKGGLSQDEAYPPTFSAIRDRILIPKCVSCHEFMMSHKKLLKGYLVPGSPEQSEIYHQVKAGEMPLYADKLLGEEIEALRLWIEKGAPLD